MKNYRGIIRKWKAARMFVAFSMIILPLMALSRLTGESQGYVGDGWKIIAAALSFMIFALILGEMMRRWFNFMIGSSDCQWIERQ